MDVQRYLTRIGVEDVEGPDLHTLASIVGGHTRAIPFENLDPFVGLQPSLELEGLSAKLIDAGRGGWCFEHNMLLRHALSALGFSTTVLAARVEYRRPSTASPGPRTHMLLRVDGLDDGPHIVDVGFGGLTLTGVLRMHTDGPQTTPHGVFRIRPEGSELAVSASLAGSWRPLYRFDLSEQLLVDLEVMGFHLSQDPDSVFRRHLLVARVEADRRIGLRDTVLTTRHLDGRVETTRLPDVALLRHALERYFLLDSAGIPDLDERLGRILATPA